MSVPDPLPVLGLLLMATTLGSIVFLLAYHVGVVRQTSVALAAHLVVASVMYASLGLWAPDAMLYDRVGDDLAGAMFRGEVGRLQITSGKEGFPYVLAVIYGLFGHHPSIGLLMNVLFCALLVPILAATARRLGGDVSACAWLAGCYPPLLLWGSVLLREASAWVLIACVVFALAGITSRHRHAASAWDWPILVLSLGLFTAVRGTAAVLLAAGAVLTVLWSARQKFWAVVVGVLGVILAGPLLSSTYGRVAGRYDLQRINTIRGSLSREARSSFSVGDVSSVTGMVQAIPVSTLRGFLGPFPWEWVRVGPFAMVEGLFWFVLLALAVHGWRRSGWDRSFIALAAPAASIIVVLAFASGNYGTLLRLREQGAVCLIPLAAMGLMHLRRHVGERRSARMAERNRRRRRARTRLLT